MNQDGRSSGLTAPNGPAQEAVIRAALANAGVPAESISYVEAHGTGTSLGDPIELRALGAVYGAGRTMQSAVITSSIKTNVGHLEAAAGVAGLAKTVLALQERRIPAHLHAESPTPHVDWPSLGVRLPARGGEVWPRGAAPRRAGVSSFGFSGTNAHVIVEEAPAEPSAVLSATDSGGADALCLLPIAARTTAAVRELSGRYAAHLQHNAAESLRDVCASAAIGRAQLAGSRAVVLSASAAAASQALARLAATAGPAVHEQLGHATILAADAAVGDAFADVAFVFTGQGGAQAGMGRELLAAWPVFRDEVARMESPFRDATGASLLAVIQGDAEHEFPRPDVSAAALVAFQIALAALWRSWGVEPAIVAGHSLGEYAAAVTAGAMGAGDALRLVAARGRAVSTLPAGHGAMAIVDASQQRIEAILGHQVGAPMALEIAAINAPEQLVLSGPASAVAGAVAQLTASGVRVRTLSGIDHAYHSAQLDPLLPAYLEVCQSAALHAPAIDWISCRTGEAQSATQPVTADYWTSQMRQPVQWRHVIETIASRGARVLIEIGPTAVLSGLSRVSLDAAGVSGAVSVASMRSSVPARQTLLDALARGWVRGMAVDWMRLMPVSARRVPLPTYPFQRERFWLAARRGAGTDRGVRNSAMPGQATPRDATLGERQVGPVPTFAVPIDERASAVVRGHVVHGQPLFAGSAFLDAALGALEETGGARATELRDIRFVAPLVVGADDQEAMLTVESRETGALVTLSSAAITAPPGAPWTRHASARAVPATVAMSARSPESLPLLSATLPQAIDHDLVYAAFTARGITLDHSVRTIHSLRRRDGEALSRLTVPASAPANARRAALLDGALQTFGVASPQFSEPAGAEPARVLAQIGSVRVSGDWDAVAWCHAIISAGAADLPWTGIIRLFDDRGVEVATLDDLVLVTPPAVPGAEASLTYRLAWEAAPLHTTNADACAVLADFTAARLVGIGETESVGDYDALIPQLETTALSYARAALTSLDIDTNNAEVTDAALRGVVPQHWPLVRRMARAVAAQSPDARASVDLTDTGRGGELELLHRCGPSLADVLRGTIDPLQLLFPKGSFEALDRIYRDSAFARTYNGALRDLIRREIELRGDAPLRILEIGAGTGGSTGYVLDVVPAHASYLFTDVSPLFLERARDRYASNANLEVRLLDIERDPLVQGFAGSSFDLIIAANVLHATADVRQTLAHVRALAAPGALLVLLEATAPLFWVDMTFGLTEGWWRFGDHDLRPDHPLLSAAQWTHELSAAGFTDVATAHPDEAAADAFRTQSVILARQQNDHAARMPLLIFSDASGVGDALVRQLATRGVAHSVVSRGGADTSAVSDEIAHFVQQHPGDVGVVYLWALDVATGVAPSDADAHLAALLTDDVPSAIMRAIGSAGQRVQLWLATRGAQAVNESPALPAPEQAPLWGWARGFSLEYPQHRSVSMDLDPLATPEESASALAEEIQQDTREDQVALRSGVRSVARLVHAGPPAQSTITIHADGAYLITGGTGGIGLRAARWLADHGAGEVVLLSRTGMPADASDPRHAALAALQASSTTVRVILADAGDAGTLGEVIARFGTEWRPLRGVVHASVAMSAAPIADISDEQRATMRRSKVDAARMLHRLTAHHPLDFLVGFSSTTALLGVHGMAHYAAANQYLDALAHYRRAQALPGLSVGWGTWDVMRVASAQDQSTITRGGLRQLHSDIALPILERLLASDAAHVVVADIDWQTLVPLYEARRSRPLIHALAVSHTRPARVARAPEAVAQRFIDRITTTAPAQRQQALEQLVRSEVAAALGFANGDTIPIDRGFFELGLDSLMSVELKRRLETAIGQSLPSTLTFNYPNVMALTAFLYESLFSVSTDAATPAASSSFTPGSPRDVTEHDEMSDDELEAELIARLHRLR